MNMKTVFIFYLFLIPGFSSYAQQDTILKYYDHSWKEVDAPRAVYYSVAFRTEHYWTRYDFYSDINKLQMKGYYIDDKLEIKEGPFVFYHRNGIVQSKGSYVNGKHHGPWISWDKQGRLLDSSMYKNGVVEKRTVYYPEGSLSEITGINSSGKIESRGFKPNGSLKYEGILKNGKKEGEWTFYLEDGKQLVQFVEDSVLNFECFDSGGKKSADCIYYQEAQLPGGFKKWQTYLTNAYPKYLPKAFFEGKLSGIILVDFLIDTDGKIKDVSIRHSSEPALNDAALRIIRTSPRWEPAIQNNQKVKSWHTQPFTFIPVSE